MESTQQQITLAVIGIEDLKQVISDAISKEFSKHIPQPAPTTDDNELIKIEEVCKILNVTKVTVHNWKRDGVLPFYRIGTRIFFKKSEIVEAVIKIKRKEV